MPVIGIRRENKGRHERRAPLAPEHLNEAAATFPDLQFVVQPSSIRVYDEASYLAAGASASEDLSSADLIMGVKEIPIELLERGQSYIFFSHTIKGQSHNMPTLRRMMELGCTLLDYERIVDQEGRRLVFFGYHAGLAGMIDGLWIFGQRLAEDGYPTALANIRQAFEYDDLAHACACVQEAGAQLASTGLPAGLPPVVFGFAGYGNVSRGAAFVFDHLPFVTVEPDDLEGLFAPGAEVAKDKFYKVVFKEEHLARRISDGGFDLQEYYDHPELYGANFHRWLPYLTGLVNCIYWSPSYPRLVTRTEVRKLHSQGALRLRVIADITCDIDGSIEMTTEATDQDNPILTYDPATDEVRRQFAGPGVSILAVDNLPCELPRDSTRHFGTSLGPYLGGLASLDHSLPFEGLAVPEEVRDAIILWNGELTPRYEYLRAKLPPI